MAYSDTVRLLKFLRLRDRLGLPTPHLLGHLELVWQYCHAFSQDRLGVLFQPPEVERVAEWEGEPGALVTAMLETGWLDPQGEHVAVHDWYAHAPEFAKKRIRRRDGDRTTADNVRTKSAKSPPERNENENENGTGTERRTEREPNDAPGARSGSGSAAFNAGNGGPETVGEVAGRLMGAARARDEDTLNRIMQLTGEGPEYLEWWRDVIARMGAAEGGGELWEAVQDTEKRIDPIQRQAKDLGELKNPGGFIASKCKAWLATRGKTLPPKPKPIPTGAGT